MIDPSWLPDHELLAGEHAPEVRAFVAQLQADLRRPWPGGPTPADIPRATPRTRWLRPALALAAAAVLAASALLTGDGLRERGATTPAVGDVLLEAAAEGATGLRPLSPGAAVAPDERVLFRVSTSGPGTLTLYEGEVVITSWAVGAGEHTPGDPPLSYRPEGSGPMTYRAELCLEETCRSDALSLSWR